MKAEGKVSPVDCDVDAGGWRGRVAGVTRIGGKAGAVAVMTVGMLAVLIVYGISTAGHHRHAADGGGVPLTKASEEHEPWWQNVPDAPAQLPTTVPVRVHRSARRAEQRAEAQEEPEIRERVPEITPIAPPVGVAQAAPRAEYEDRRHALLDAAINAPVNVRFDDGGSGVRDEIRHLESDGAFAPLIAASGTERGSVPSGMSVQDERLNFMAEAAANTARDRIAAVRRADPTPFVIHAGSVIPATLLTGINADLPGTIVGQVRDDVFDSVSGRFLIIPAGAKLIGTYDSRVMQGERRVLVAWKRLLYPDGSALDLLGMAGTDPSGYAGFGAQVDEHLGKEFNAALLLSVISAGAQLSQPQRSATASVAPDMGQTIAGAFGQQIAGGSMQLAQRQAQITPTLEVEPGYHFDVLVDRDIVLSEPYVAGSAR